MASKNVQKDDTAPPLLLMPAGKGLTMNTSLESFSSNVLMPVAQSGSSLMTSDDAEVDSFVGQSPPRNASASDLFSKASDDDCPFSNITQPLPNQPRPPAVASLFGSSQSQSSVPAARTTPPVVQATAQPVAQNSATLFAPSAAPMAPNSANLVAPSSATLIAPSAAATAPAAPTRPLFQPTPPSSVPLFRGQPTQTQSQPAIAAVPTFSPQSVPQTPPTAGASQGGYHRPASGPRYAQPTNLYASSSYSSQFQSTAPPPVAEVSPMPNPYYASQTSQPAYQPYNASSVNLGMSPTTDYSSNTMDDFTYSSSSSYAGSPAAMYSPVQPHWFYCQISERTEWIPMSLLDSMRVEEAYQQYCHTGEVGLVATDGGRYDVDLKAQNRTAVYWDEAPTEIRRCTWFFKNEGDNRFIPYDTEFAARLEEEYRTALLNNIWHKRLEFAGGEMIVIHNPNVIVHFRPSSLPDEWGTTQGEQLRPRVVKRGIEEFENIKDGEKDQIDHLILVVHGIGEFCDIKFRSLVHCVDDMRSIADQLISTHFKHDLETGRIGRIEFLPVHWHQALHGDDTGIDTNLRRITLKSIPKLRTYTNDTLLDILFYTSPKYCQTIINTACSELNRLYRLFMTRNPDFLGNISTAGHSLGSAVLFDLLCHQVKPESVEPESEHEESEQEAEQEPEEQEKEDDLSLEAMLEKLELTEFSEKFESERIDSATLTTLTDEDLKEMGLPLGPRKQVLAYLQDHQERKTREKVAAEKRARLEKDRRSRLNGDTNGVMTNSFQVSDPLLPGAARSSVNFLCGVAGTGQPFVTYPKLHFELTNFFALGSPIALFLTTRGINRIGDEYRLPLECGMFNIFHPFDPVAYRIEPLIDQNFSDIKPVLIPHHKGRKRLHLELKESLAKVGADIKQKIMDSLRSTWNSLNEFARAHRGQQDSDDQQEVDNMLKQIASAADANADDMSVAESITTEEDICIGSLNGGRRIDYVLQEKPIESFNDYLFALASHLCYWQSEDTALLMLKETYATMGVYPEKRGPNGQANFDPRVPPPVAGFERRNPVQKGPSPTMFTPPSAAATVAPPPPVPLHAVNQSQQPMAPPTLYNAPPTNGQQYGAATYNPSPMSYGGASGTYAPSQNFAPQQNYAQNYAPTQSYGTPSSPYQPPPQGTYQPTPPASAPPRPVGPPPMAGFVRKT